MEDCVFCKIIKTITPQEIVKETDNLVVFKDINPKAPIHLLIVPKAHLKDITEVGDSLWAEVKNLTLQLAQDNKLSGFRLINNMGSAATVKHFHVHFMGGVTAEREL